jgi:uncharacterized protein (TIGR03435 family)
LPGGIGFSRNDRNVVERLFAINSSIVGLYQFAIPAIEKFQYNRMLLQVTSPGEYFAEMKNGSLQHTYCYELKMTAGTTDDFKIRLKYELDKIFNLSTKLEKRKVKCFVLKNKGKLNALKSRGEESVDNLYEDDKNNQKYFTNQPVSYLINYLNDQLTIPLVDETNISGPIDLKFCFDPHNLKNLKSTLLDSGLELVETVREMDMFIIREKESKNNHQSKNSK